MKTKNVINFFACIFLGIACVSTLNFLGAFFQENISILTIVRSGISAVIFGFASIIMYNWKSKPIYTIKEIEKPQTQS